MFRIVKASTTSGEVGIWWYTDDGEVIGLRCTLDEGDNTGTCIEYPYERNHMNSFQEVVRSARPDDADDIIKLGFKGIERGRVRYEIVTHCYYVTCGKGLIYNKEFRSKIKEFYHLSGCMVEFEEAQHYTVLPLTGNPAIDDFNYDM